MLRLLAAALRRLRENHARERRQAEDFGAWVAWNAARVHELQIKAEEARASQLAALHTGE